MEERELTPKPNAPKLDRGGKNMPDEPKPPEETPEEKSPEQIERENQDRIRRLAQAEAKRKEEARRAAQSGGQKKADEPSEKEEPLEKKNKNPVPKELHSLSEYLWLRYLDKAELTEREIEKAHQEWPPTEIKPHSGSEEMIRLMSDLKNEEDFKDELDEGGFIRSYMIGAQIYIERAENPRLDKDDFERIVRDIDKKITGIFENSTDFAKLKVNTITLVNELTKQQDEARRNERSLRAPAGIRELALDIMYATGGEFARNGKYALLEYAPDGKEVFHPENLLRWVRNRMIYYHKADPDNPNINLNAQVNVFGNFRDIAIQQMIDNPVFFTDEKTGTEFKELRQQVIYELWLFGQSRSIDAFYRQQMGSDVELPKMLSQIYQSNAFTKEGTLSRILTLMNLDKGSEVDFSEGEEKGETNQQTGQALRHALLSYYYLPDREMLEKISQAETSNERRGERRDVMFNNKDFVDAYVDAKLSEWLDTKNKTVGELDEKERATYERKKTEFVKEGKKRVALSDFYMDEDKKALSEEDWKDDKIVTDELRRIHLEHRRDMELAKRKAEREGEKWSAEEYRKKQFILHTNVYNNQEKDIRTVNETKERIKLLIREKHNISYSEADYAETFAYTMTRWTGIGAKNDTGSIGFDAWTKVLDTQGYRERQAAEARAGVHGNPYSFAGIRRLGASFVHANDKSGKSIIEWIQGGQGEDINLKTEIKGMSFGERAMQSYAANHINRSFNLFTKIIDSDEFNFDKFITIDSFGRVIFNPNEAGKVIDGIFKDIRYAYCTYPDFNYSKKVRVRTKEWNFEKKRNEDTYKTVTLAEMLWGDQVLENMAKKTKEDMEFTNLNLEVEKRKPNVGDVVQHSDNRPVMWKEVLKYLIAAEIYAHRDINSPYKRYTPAEVEEIYGFLLKYNFEISPNPYDLKDIERKKGTFTAQDVQWMRRASATTKAKMVGEELIWGQEGGAWGFFGGLMKAAQLAVSNATKAA